MKPNRVILAALLAGAGALLAGGDPSRAAGPVVGRSDLDQPGIFVQPAMTHVEAGFSGAGGLRIHVLFFVRAEAGVVRLWAGATDLYRGDRRGDPLADPIPLDTAAGAVFDVSGAVPRAGSLGRVGFVGRSTLGGYACHDTEMVAYESRARGGFDHPIAVSLAWEDPGPDRPMGDYIGRVKLSAMVLPVTDR